MAKKPVLILYDDYSITTTAIDEGIIQAAAAVLNLARHHGVSDDEVLGLADMLRITKSARSTMPMVIRGNVG